MLTDDANDAIRLDLDFDELLLGHEPRSGELDAHLAALRQMHSLFSRPVPDAAFVQRLQEELIHGVEMPAGVVPRIEETRHKASAPTALPRYVARPEPHTLVDGRPGPASARNGRAWQAPISGGVVTRPTSHHVWQRLRLAAALLILLAFAGNLAVSRVGLLAPKPAQLSALSMQEGVVPKVLSNWDTGIEALIEPSMPLAGSATPDENIWATGWRNGRPVPTTEPDDPYSVTWLQGSAALGEGGNVVLQGHNDDGRNGPGVFSDLGKLSPMSIIFVSGTNDVTYGYTVDWVRRFPSRVDAETQRGILGPTAEESLTLITPAGTFDAKANRFPEVLVVRARHEWTDGLTTLHIPDPTSCDVAPRAVSELDALARTFTSKQAQLPAPTPPDALASKPADPITAAAVVATTRTLTGCLNANDALRSFALYTDAGLLRLFGFMTSAFSDPAREWTPDFASAGDRATPAPQDDLHVLWRVDDVRLLPDGRVSAIVDISPSEADDVPHFPFGQPALYIFAREGAGFRIDEVIAPLPDLPRS